MRKVALLLASLGIMAAAYAEQPKLVVTNVGQEIEIENTNGKQDFDQVNLFNNVGLAYGDWSFGLQAGKQWNVNLGDDSGIHSQDHRLQLDVWKKVNDDLKLGARFRGTSSYDRWYARWDYKHGMLWSAGDVWYQAENAEDDGRDSLQFEVFPIGVQYGPVKVGYFLNYVKQMGDIKDTEKEDYIEHQIRAYATLYKGEKLTISTEGRFTLCADDGYKGSEPKAGYKHYDDFGRIRVYLGADYKVSENLNVYAKYAYEFRDWKYEGDYSRASYHGEENYQDIIVGWNYKF